ncbi:MAG: 3-oxoacid CoA-transferase subunit A [Chloroflexi bacterium]|nr:3-oxoacid CoA-transferase subunit A [Chloroflexota bacterium]
MTIDKRTASMDAAVADLQDGASIMVGGFGDVGLPFELVDAVVRRGIENLTLISNNCGTGEVGLARLWQHRRVRKVIASFPAQRGNHHFLAAYEEGGVEVVIVPQGTLAERIRAAGAGIGGFYTPTGVGTVVAEGKETRRIDGREYLLELPLFADVALIKAHTADPYGNLRYRLSAQNFNPIMATACTLTIAQVERLVPVGGLDPDDIHTPGLFVDRVVLGSAP